MPVIAQHSFWSGWQQRLNALRNIPPVLRIVWASGPPVIAAGLFLRVVAALIPVAMLSISRLIIDAIVSSKGGSQPTAHIFWWLVSLEFALAALGSLLGRAIGFFDSLFADRFTRHVSIRVMEHASRLDLASYEDPVFYDKLETHAPEPRLRNGSPSRPLSRGLSPRAFWSSHPGSCSF